MQMARHSRCFCRKQGEMRQASVEMRLRFVSLQCAPGARQWGEAVLPPGTTCVSSLACCMRSCLPGEGLKLWRHTAPPLNTLSSNGCHHAPVPPYVPGADTHLDASGTGRAQLDTGLLWLGAPARCTEPCCVALGLWHLLCLVSPSSPALPVPPLRCLLA